MIAQTLFTTSCLALVALVSAQAEPGWTGTIHGMDGGLAGTFEVIDDKTLKLTGFTLEDGSAPALYWWGSETEDLSSGFRISEEQVEGEHENEELTIALDSGKTAKDFSYAGLWCEQFNANFGVAKLSEGGASGGDSSSSSDSDSNSGSSSGSGSGGDSSGVTRASLASMGLLAAAAAFAILIG
ncbi:hypothetical protein jhhlp_004999 [Lomentospora prolificans]|uniref:DM13 domain-containing protein n=1 Tax=Lomentospora prolificans TaxID=41688 RepID=A0A2N3N843_9PEZI|nr:hypothetical protein jhhlp_004999 [Lomentospora prolificans]